MGEAICPIKEDFRFMPSSSLEPDFDISWKTLRFRRKLLVVAYATLVPSSLILEYCLFPMNPNERKYVLYAAACVWILFVGFCGGLLSKFHCPNCGRKFCASSKRGFSQFVKQCANCRQKAYGKPGEFN